MITHHGHPDPNLLAAFSDGSLTAMERAALLDHLSACQPCRECVSLAARSLMSKPPRPTNHWPIWAGFAAAMIAFLLTASLWHRYPSASPHQLSVLSPLRQASNSSKRFEHLRLTRPEDSPPAISLLSHLIRKRPRQDQLVVTGPYGERWLTLQTAWSLPGTTAESPGTVN